MKPIIYYLCSSLLCSLSFVSHVQGQIRDYDSTVYNTVNINSDVWTIENLITDHFRNGDSIPEAQSDEEWLQFGQDRKPAFCYYEFNPANRHKYGKLYNWYAVIDLRGLAPRGWHIPRDEDWKGLVQELGGVNEAGKRMKSTKGWGNLMDFTGNGTNYSEFSGLPGGILRTSDELVKFFNKGNNGYWWSSTDASKPTVKKEEEVIAEKKEEAKPGTKHAAKDAKAKPAKPTKVAKPVKAEPAPPESVEILNANNAWMFSLSATTDKILRLSANKMSGLSVRCVRD